MRTAFVTLANKRFQKALDVLTFSLKTNSPEFWKHVDKKILITPDIESHSDYEICKVQPKQYPFCGNPKYEVNCCKMHLFSFTEFDRIVFYEADTLCLGEIGRLLGDLEYANDDFSSVIHYYMGLGAYRMLRGSMKAIIGDGWVVNKKLLDGAFHKEVIDLSKNCGLGFKMADQDAITILLDNDKISKGTLNPIFDFLRVIPEISNGGRELYESMKNKIKMVHYVGKNKPFLFEGELTGIPETVKNPLDKIWYEYYLRSKE